MLAKLNKNIQSDSYIIALGSPRVTFTCCLQSDPEFRPVDDQGKLIYSDDDYVDTWQQMEKCVAAGLTRSIGVSNFNVEQLKRVLAAATIKPVANQIEVSKLH